MNPVKTDIDTPRQSILFISHSPQNWTAIKSITVWVDLKRIQKCVKWQVAISHIHTLLYIEQFSVEPNQSVKLVLDFITQYLI